jgi:hypothetical protein
MANIYTQGDGELFLSSCITLLSNPSDDNRRIRLTNPNTVLDKTWTRDKIETISVGEKKLRYIRVDLEPQVAA